MAGAQAFPQFVNFQGRVTDASGNLINTAQGLTFRLFNAPTGGSALWSETQTNVPVSNGLFSALLGSVTSLPLSAFSTAPVYLEVAVGNNTLSPRKLLNLSSPYAASTGLLQGNDLSMFLYYAPGSGFVGLGTSAPAATLHVSKSAAGLAAIVEDGGANDEALRLQTTGGGTRTMSLLANQIASNAALNIGNGQSTILRTDIGPSRVGVGTLSPAQTLDVNGTMRSAFYVVNGAAAQGVMLCQDIAYGGGDTSCPGDGIMVAWGTGGTGSSGCVGNPGGGSGASCVIPGAPWTFPASGTKRCCYK